MQIEYDTRKYVCQKCPESESRKARRQCDARPRRPLQSCTAGTKPDWGRAKCAFGKTLSLECKCRRSESRSWCYKSIWPWPEMLERWAFRLSFPERLWTWDWSWIRWCGSGVPLASHVARIQHLKFVQNLSIFNKKTSQNMLELKGYFFNIEMSQGLSLTAWIEFMSQVVTQELLVSCPLLWKWDFLG